MRTSVTERIHRAVSVRAAPVDRNALAQLFRLNGKSLLITF